MKPSSHSVAALADLSTIAAAAEAACTAATLAAAAAVPLEEEICDPNKMFTLHYGTPKHSPQGNRRATFDRQSAFRSQGHGHAVLRQQNNQHSPSSELTDESAVHKSLKDLLAWHDHPRLFNQHDSISVKSLSGLGGSSGSRQDPGVAPRSKSQPSTLLSKKSGVKRRREERADERPMLDFCKMMQTAYKENDMERTRVKSRSGNLPSSSSSAHIDLLMNDLSNDAFSNLSSLRKSLPSPSFKFAVTTASDMTSFNFNAAPAAGSRSPFMPVCKLEASAGPIKPVCQMKYRPGPESQPAELAPPHSPFVPVNHLSITMQASEADDLIGGDSPVGGACCVTDCSSDDELSLYMSNNNNNTSNDSSNINDDGNNDAIDDDDYTCDIESGDLKLLDIDLDMIENN